MFSFASEKCTSHASSELNTDLRNKFLPSKFELFSASSTNSNQRHVEFTAAGFAPLLEAVGFSIWSLEEFQSDSSSGNSSAKDREEGICLRDEEGQRTSQRRYRHSSRSESVSCRDRKASRKSECTGHRAGRLCDDVSHGRYLSLKPGLRTCILTLPQVC